ncbi:glycoside hydrolase family 16 protein [Streptomyces sp. NRRL F-5755]|uniref:glycoside hydrolase family 16 protein n=1 Tax=Streptomyces sp. NRRL F-5755 TaxID=1519475 RepID=UPI001F259675|nr:glycoside hydrolase family 16 protein [Streptomyces sp. NRRL F-5755]
MNIDLWRPRSGGDVHSAAVVPKKLMDQAYGKFSARLKVTRAAPGYKSAWLHYGHGCELDYPEQNWTDTIHAFTHACDGGRQDAFPTKARWTDWHTVSTEWTPDHVKYFLDGKLIGPARGTPDRPLSWIVQNESALYGPYAAPGSRANLQITWVAGYTYGSTCAAG